MENIKSVTLRLNESKSIHEQVQKMGIMMDPVNRDRLRKASNDFVRTGIASVVKLRIDEKSRAVVHFKGLIGLQSGVILEHC